MSASIRLFVDAPLQPGVAVATTAGQAHYLARVMRRTLGDAVLLFNGRDGEWRARIAQLGRAAALLDVVTRVRPQPPEPDLWLLFAPLRRDLNELVVQKATELGAALIRPVTTQHTNPGRVARDRLALIAVEAAEQSERCSVPAIEPPQKLPDLLAAWPAGRRLVVAMERERAPPPRAAPGPAALLVGPEGGFAAAELDALHAHAFVEPASLGPRILRAETAAIVGLALLSSALP